MTQGIMSVDTDLTQPRHGFRFWGRKRAPTALNDGETEPKKLPRQVYVPTHAAVDFRQTTSPRYQAFDRVTRQPQSRAKPKVEAWLATPPALGEGLRESSSTYSAPCNERVAELDEIDEGIDADAEPLAYLDELSGEIPRPRTSASPKTDYEIFIAKAEAEERARRVSARWSAYQQQVIAATRSSTNLPLPHPTVTVDASGNSKRDSGYHTHSRHGSYEPGFGPKSRESLGLGLQAVSSAGDLRAAGVNIRGGGVGLQRLDDQRPPSKFMQYLGEYIRPSRAS
jgi:hypothetical protein